MTGALTCLLLVSCSKPWASDVEEASAIVRRMARSADDAFHREIIGDPLPDAEPLYHRLCRSAEPVPRILPTDGQTWQPDDRDFLTRSSTNDHETGWLCLKFSVAHPTKFRLTYVAGGPYKSLARGGEDPGRYGFEACAEADLVPGGETTLVCAIGGAIPERGTFWTRPKLFVSDERW